MSTKQNFTFIIGKRKMENSRLKEGRVVPIICITIIPPAKLTEGIFIGNI